MTKKKLFYLALFTLFSFPLLGFIIHYFTTNIPFHELFYSEYSLLSEILLGSALGSLIAVLGWELLKTNYLKQELNKYSSLFSPESLSYPLIIFVSLSAGIGEEIFFRGVIQPFLGVVLTAVIFVAIHGYLNPKNIRISIYGVYMTVAIILIGYLTQLFGLISAISAHTFIDIILLLKTKERLRN